MGMADRIKKQRLLCGYTQEELADKIGLQKSAIAKYENGRVENIKRSIIEKMAIVLECSPAYLMGWDEPEVSTTVKFNSSIDALLYLEIVDNIEKMNTKGLEETHRYTSYLITNKELCSNIESNESNHTNINPYDNDTIVPFPQYPTVTLKDIRSFAARNAKKLMSDEEIAKLIYTLEGDD